MAADSFHYALSSNAAWAGYKCHQNPTFFAKQTKGQTPSILWIGCSDSRVPETTLLGLQPGDVFVHRNIANVVSPTDISVSAVIEYAVIQLKVSHIVLCGHTCCGGAAAALSNGRIGGVLDTWLTPLKTARKQHEEELQGIKDDSARAVRLAELNVEKGVEVLKSMFVVEEAMKERGLDVHGVLYDIGVGKIRDLGAGCHGGRGEEKGEIVKGKHGMLVFGNGGAAMAIR
ncbi:carbonic anhydrase [Calycina marina]|uniref:Carbonic anhydrase n=1 Tax=Calycina marina TaxID=1763456 RepID=A0A9P7Z151_9HELO|nr:carbonic anhydrase [Calycina marina]